MLITLLSFCHWLLLFLLKKPNTVLCINFHFKALKYSHGSLQITCKMFILQTDCLQNQNLGLGLGVSCCMETQVGSQEFSTALLKRLWGHRDQRAVVCDIKQGLSGSQKKWKCPDSTGELTVPCVHLMKLVKLLAGVLETRSNATDHKPS